MNKIIENYDQSSEKIKVNVPLTSNLDEIHRDVLKSLDINSFPNQTKKETINSQLLTANESLRVALESKATLETEVSTLNTTIENLNSIIAEKTIKLQN